MSKDIFIGNTDHDWFDFCKSLGKIEYVNFWRPSKQTFKALDVGGVFFFRRKSPINLIGGFGEFVATGQISIKDAWDNIGILNGVKDLQDFVARVSKYRKTDSTSEHDLITFNLLNKPLFLNEDTWFDLPRDWSSNIVTGKSYDSSTLEGYSLLQKTRNFRDFNENFDKDIVGFDGFSDNPVSGYGTNETAKVRIGQGAFRLSIIGAYSGKCAVTGSTVAPTLEAAHINKFSSSQNHHVSNGILLRRDIHKLFDEGLLSFTSDYRVKVSSKFKLLYPEANEYLSLDGQALILPENKQYHPIIQ